MGITTLRRRHDYVEVAEADERQPNELETAQAAALEARDAAAAKVDEFKAQHGDWESFDDESDEGQELNELEAAAQLAEDELTQATQAADDARRVEQQAELDAARPAKSAKVDEWREFAVKFGGISEDEAAGLKKPELQALEISLD